MVATKRVNKQVVKLRMRLNMIIECDNSLQPIFTTEARRHGESLIAFVLHLERSEGSLPARRLPLLSPTGVSSHSHLVIATEQRNFWPIGVVSDEEWRADGKLL